MSNSLLDEGAKAPEATTTTTAPEAPTEPSVSIPDFMKDWKLDPEIAKEEALLNFKSPEDLVKSYVHAKKFVGADKIKVPSSHTTDEEWKQIYTKLGLPESPDKYKLDLPADIKLDQEFLNKFLGSAHASGILPKQAENIVKFYNEQIAENIKVIDAERKESYEKNQKELKDAWGEAYSDNLNSAKFAVKELGGEELEKHLRETGFFADAKVVMMLAKAGKALSGDSVPGVKNSTGGTLTPEQAAIKMDEIRAEMIKINDSNNPKYLALQKEQNIYAKYAYPDQMGVAPADGE